MSLSIGFKEFKEITLALMPLSKSNFAAFNDSLNMAPIEISVMSEPSIITLPSPNMTSSGDTGDPPSPLSILKYFGPSILSI